MQPQDLKFKFSHPAQTDYLTVMIPVYKDHAGLEVTLKSLEGQKFNKVKYEILVGNDGGNIDVKNVCNRFKVKCIESSFQKGSYSTRNKLIVNSSGEFLAFIDAGTIADELWLEKGYKALLGGYDYVGGSVEVIQTENNRVSEDIYLFQKTTSFAVKEYMSNLSFAPTTNLFVKRKVFQKLDGFDERLISSGDYEFGSRVATDNHFSQYYDHNVKVYHLARDYKSLVKKQKRLAQGFVDLVSLYPKRFPNLNDGLFIKLIKIVAPPIWLFKRELWRKLSFKNKIKVFFLAYHFSSIGHFYRLVYTIWSPSRSLIFR